MSEDLFAAFGEVSQSLRKNDLPSAPSTSNSRSFNELLDPSDTGQPSLDDDFDDDFGDFEDASAPAIVATPVDAHTRDPVAATTKSTNLPFKEKPKAESSVIGRHPFADHMDFLFDAADEDDYNAGADDLNDLSNNPEAAVAFSKRLFAAQLAEQEREVPQFPISSKATQPQRNQPTATVSAPSKIQGNRLRDANVLFDAEEDLPEVDDSFGDFEGGDETVLTSSNNSSTQERQQTEPEARNLDLLGLEDNLPDVDKLPIRGTRPGHGQPAKKTVQPSAVPDRVLPASTAPSWLEDDDDDDGWDDFETAVAPQISKTSTKPPPAPPTDTIDRKKQQPPGKDPSDSLPPTNIPPPGILLSIFPAIFASAEDSLFKPLAKLDAKQRQALMRHPATEKFLHKYINTMLVLGHIIAGRKLRWKRDQYLVQGMRIGPAAAGGKGGMKLTGIDKSEIVKEDREVLDAVRLWKAQVGKLRGAVTSRGSTGNPAANARLPTVPDIAEQMPVKTLKAVEGGSTAPYACALCGLKREERVARVQSDVEDSFGEYWLQGVGMHVVCRRFWNEHKGLLQSR